MTERGVSETEARESTLPPVQLPQFSGPLDLLLHLIRVNEVVITDIPIALITEQYTQYLNLMQELDLDVAAEYIYLAAILIHIKSKFLLPRDPDAPPGEDPRQELVERLLEYEKFKRSAETFHEIDTLRAGLWPRPAAELPRDTDGSPALEVSIADLMGAFRTVLDRYRFAHPEAMEVRRMRFSLRDKMSELLRHVEPGKSVPLLEFLGVMRYRAEAITAFLACLELTRIEILRLFQPAPFAEIHVSRTEKAFDPARIQDEYHD